MVSTASRALPLLLVFIAFLFINAEAWQMTSSLDFGTLWLAALLLLGAGHGFLLVRLPEEVDQADDAVDDAFLLRACRGTPLEAVVPRDGRRPRTPTPRPTPRSPATSGGT